MNKIIFLLFIFLFGCINQEIEIIQENTTIMEQNNEDNINLEEEQVRIEIIDITTTSVGMLNSDSQNQNIDKEQEQILNENLYNTNIDNRYTNLNILGNNILVYFFNLPYSEATLIRKGDLNVLIDSGDEKNAPTLVNLLRNLHINKINILISTNQNEKKSGGLEAIIDSFIVDEFWYNGLDFKNERYNKIINSLYDNRISKKIAKAQDKTIINGIEFTILNPGKNEIEINNNLQSLVLKISGNDNCIYFLSDSDADVQRKIIKSNTTRDLLEKCELIVAPRQGYGASANELLAFEFMQIIDPDIAIIFSGESKGVGTTKEIISMMRNRNSRTYTTEEFGTIRVTLIQNRDIIEIDTEKK